MSFLLKDVTLPTVWSLLGRYDTHEQALDALRKMNPKYIMEDEMYPFFVDAMGKDGRIFVIEPDQIA